MARRENPCVSNTVQPHQSVDQVPTFEMRMVTALENARSDRALFQIAVVMLGEIHRTTELLDQRGIVNAAHFRSDLQYVIDQYSEGIRGSVESPYCRNARDSLREELGNAFAVGVAREAIWTMLSVIYGVNRQIPRRWLRERQQVQQTLSNLIKRYKQAASEPATVNYRVPSTDRTAT
jgi:hypothetical protein